MQGRAQKNLNMPDQELNKKHLSKNLKTVEDIWSENMRLSLVQKYKRANSTLMINRMMAVRDTKLCG